MSLPILQPLSNAFDDEDRFRKQCGEKYSLLPFRFLRLDAKRYIVTNFAGQYILLTHQVLRDLINHRLLPNFSVYEELKSRHFLVDGDSSVALDLLACQFRTRHSLLQQLTGLFLFVVTLRCEHSCPYCQVSRQSSDRRAFDMSQEHASLAIDIMFSTPSKHIKVEFQGGEPLLNFELIHWIVSEVNSRNTTHNKQVDFVIASNLAILDDSILDYCHRNKISLSTSLDGPSELHNSNRPRPTNNSYELAISGIERARNALGNPSISALMTTTQASLSQPEAIVDEYVKRGFSSIFLRALSPFGFAVKSGAMSRYTSEDWLVFYKRGLEHIFALNAAGTPFREEYAAFLMRKILTPFPIGYVDLQSPAGMGLGCMVFNYDGYVYGSDEARMLAEMRETQFRLGHVEHNSFEDLLTSEKYVKWIESTMTESMPMCADCGIQPYCGSDPLYHFSTQGDIVGNKPESGFCRKQMELVRFLIAILEDRPEAAKVLRTWIA